jgi:hypothetical protein
LCRELDAGGIGKGSGVFREGEGCRLEGGLGAALAWFVLWVLGEEGSGKQTH